MVSLALVLGLVHILRQRIFHSTGTIRRKARIFDRGQYYKAHKLENCKVFVRLSHGATIMPRRPSDRFYGKIQMRLFFTSENDLPSGKGNKDIAETIINLAMFVKTQSRGVTISGITVRKDKHQNKVQEINDQLRDLCQANNINFIDHSKSIKPQHLNKSRLHLTKRGTSILSTTFVREISNIFH